MNTKKKQSSLLVLVLLAIWLAGCANLSVPGFQATPSRTPFRPITNTPSPSPTSTPVPTPTPVPSPTPEVSGLWAAGAVPDSLKQRVTLPPGWVWVEQADQALLRLEPAAQGGEAPIQWVYAVAAPFPTVQDEVAQEDLRQAWRGQYHESFNGKPLLLAGDTRRVLQQFWGEPGGDLSEVPSGELLDAAWQERTWAVIPFDALEPRWKALRVDGNSLLVRGELQGYSLVFGFSLNGDPLHIARFYTEGGSIPASNRDPARMTAVLMTGTTALVRAVGWRMEGLGLDYPARDIRDWLIEPDFTHISNEASFNPACPRADPNQDSLMFCSRPEYIQLLDAIQPDIIELSGNHNNDWGREAFNFSLDLYRERGWRWYAGGANSQEASQPLLLEHNGNRLAFIGCNIAGPPAAWATSDLPGAAKCDLEESASQVRTLREQGYLPIMTLQYYEIYVSFPSERQERDFRALSAAGATIVSGSQSHFPQGFAFEEGRLIHYGLGNLFFDQMDTPVDGTRRELLDRHIFYDGRHLATEVLTAMLEDYSRPRPMTEDERRALLADIFSAVGW